MSFENGKDGLFFCGDIAEKDTLESFVDEVIKNCKTYK